MAAFGLQNYWEKRFLTKPMCEGNFNRVMSRRLTLSLANLFGPFLLLLAGMGISFVVFVFERVHFWIQPKKTVKQNKVVGINHLVCCRSAIK